MLEEQATNRTTAHSTQDLNSHLYCPHDLSLNTEFRDDLPTLLGKDLSGPTEDTQKLIISKIIKKIPSISVFGEFSTAEVCIHFIKTFYLILIGIFTYSFVLHFRPMTSE